MRTSYSLSSVPRALFISVKNALIPTLPLWFGVRLIPLSVTTERVLPGYC